MIHVYYANIGMLADASIFEEVLNQVQKQRRSKVLRCKNKQEQKRVLLAGWLLKQALESVGLDYSQTIIERTAQGKPYVASHPQYHISLSHSGDFAVCGIADTPIGVDVEGKERTLFQVNRAEAFAAVANKCLTAEEYKHFLLCDEETQVEFFLTQWTRKEAVSKVSGKGLSMDFSAITEPEECFYTFDIEKEYYVSVYVENGIREDLKICMMS